MLKFGEYRPDVSDLNSGATNSILNVIPRSDGYGPLRSLETFTQALADRGRGMFFATHPTSGEVTIFAGTSTKLYKLNNTDFSWGDVSQGSGTYGTMGEQAQWQFAQFNNLVIAVHANAAPQVYNLVSSSEFADLGGSPPNAAYISIINRFVVLSGLQNNPNRVQWSALNDATGWTAGTNNSDYQDLPDGGPVQGVVGGELGVIVQESSVRSMIFQPGSGIIFRIDVLAKNVGCIAPYSITYINDRIFWLSKRGFVQANASGQIAFIGREKVDRTFLAEYDSKATGLIIGAADPTSHLIKFTYKLKNASDETEFTRAMAYDWMLERWTPIEVTGQYLSSIAQPGFTLEGLDTIGQVAISNAANNGSGLIRLTVASTTGWTTGDYKTVSGVAGTTEANGDWTITVIDGTNIDLQASTFSNAYTSGGYVAGSIDDLEFSLDSLEASTLPAMAALTSANKIAFFTGSTKEATIETAEISQIQRRMFIRGFHPVTDASSLTGTIATRENLNATPVYKTAQSITTQGLVPQRASTRSARAKITIPAGTTWTYASGVEMDQQQSGKR